MTMSKSSYSFQWYTVSAKWPEFDTWHLTQTHILLTAHRPQINFAFFAASVRRCLRYVTGHFILFRLKFPHVYSVALMRLTHPFLRRNELRRVNLSVCANTVIVGIKCRANDNLIDHRIQFNSPNSASSRQFMLTLHAISCKVFFL